MTERLSWNILNIRNTMYKQQDCMFKERNFLVQFHILYLFFEKNSFTIKCLKRTSSLERERVSFAFFIKPSFIFFRLIKLYHRGFPPPHLRRSLREAVTEWKFKIPYNEAGCRIKSGMTAELWTLKFIIYLYNILCAKNILFSSVTACREFHSSK